MPDDLPATARDLVWALWRELGVAGVVRLDTRTVVDPDWLIAYTPVLAPGDERLREASNQWHTQHDSWVSTRRLRAIVGDAPPEVESALEMWRVAPPERPRRYAIDFSRPSMAWIRARALFGVGAKADMICAILGQGEGWFRPVDLGNLGYTRRTSSAVLRDLTDGQLLVARGAGPGQSYRLRQAATLEQLLTAREAGWQRWDVVLPWLTSLLALHRLPATTERVARVRTAEAAESCARVSRLLSWTPLEHDEPMKWAQDRLTTLLQTSSNTS